MCGKKKKRLDIHHKDKNKSNNSIENLIKLCRRCHMTIDGRIFIWNNKSWENSRGKKQSPELIKKRMKATKITKISILKKRLLQIIGKGVV